MKLLFLFALCIVLSYAILPRFNIRHGLEFVHRDQFDMWMSQHKKVYATAEEKNLRFQNFKASLDRITMKNTKSSGATYGLNKFSDMSPEEFKEKILMKPITPPSVEEKTKNVISPSPVDAAPTSFDWRNNKVVTAVKDQGQCGSCWAFSVTENIESVWMLANHITNATMTLLSPQQIVDCDTTDDGCNGGEPTDAYEYVISTHGLDSLNSYPYTAEDGTCKFKPSAVVASIDNWKYGIQNGDENQMAANLASTSPFSICVDAQYWQDYTGGVLTAWECAWINSLDHCVQATGFNTQGSSPYWIVRNSWGTDWGISGYILLQFGANTCGLTKLVTTAITNQ